MAPIAQDQSALYSVNRIQTEVAPGAYDPKETSLLEAAMGDELKRYLESLVVQQRSAGDARDKAFVAQLDVIDAPFVYHLF